jgi:opacity protein-like surface antigen
MQGYVRGIAALALALSAGVANAQGVVPPIPAPAQGVTLGARAAWAIPAGSSAAGFTLGSDFTGAVPLSLDLLYRFDRYFSAGFYFTYAPGIAKDCPSGATCSQSFTRFGLQAAYTLDRSGSLRPWFGIGVGYEWLRLDIPGGSGTLSGFEWANLQVGGDFAVTARFFVGPYVGVSFGQFSDASGSLFGTGSGASIPSGERRFHEWITVGLRGLYEF